MIAFLRECFDFVVYVCKASPEFAWPLLVGLLFSFAFTHRAKRRIPLHVSDERRHQITESIAFWSAFVTTWLLWIMATSTALHRTYGGFAAFIVGAASPLIYKALRLYLAIKCPQIRERWSGDRKP